jgi:hypothetical protein
LRLDRAVAGVVVHVARARAACTAFKGILHRSWVFTDERGNLIRHVRGVFAYFIQVEQGKY